MKYQEKTVVVRISNETKERLLNLKDVWNEKSMDSTIDCLLDSFEEAEEQRTFWEETYEETRDLLKLCLEGRK
jgi:hypothetical protein